jgi:hypothetical protein
MGLSIMAARIVCGAYPQGRDKLSAEATFGDASRDAVKNDPHNLDESRNGTMSRCAVPRTKRGIILLKARINCKMVGKKNLTREVEGIGSAKPVPALLVRAEAHAHLKVGNNSHPATDWLR